MMETRSLVAAVTIASMSWFREFAGSLGSSRSELQDLTSWAREQLQDLKAYERPGLGWHERLELEEQHIRPKLASTLRARGLVVRYLDRLLAAKSSQLAPLNDWLLALGVVADPSCVGDDALDRLGFGGLKKEFLARCPKGSSSLFATLNLPEVDEWDEEHRLIWEPKYDLATARVWDGLHAPLVASLLLHDAPIHSTDDDAAMRITNAVASHVDLGNAIVGWQSIRLDLGLL